MYIHGKMNCWTECNIMYIVYRRYKSFTFHSFRRSAATAAADTGATAAQLTDFFGWKNPSMTTEYISTSKAAVNNMASLLFPEKEEVSRPDMNGETSKQSSESNSQQSSESNSQHLLGNEEEKKAARRQQNPLFKVERRHILELKDEVDGVRGTLLAFDKSS